MAVMPGTEWRPVSDGNSRLSMARYDIVCVHTLVGYALGGSAAHWSTRWDGYIYQWRDTKNQSAANLYGNPRVLAIENEDHGPAFGDWDVNDGRAVPWFTLQQCEAIAHICAWAYKVHGIPLVLCPDSKPGSRGIAYHRQGCTSDNNYEGYAYPGRVSGGEVWSTAKGKVCPGDRRIEQLIEVIIPRARVLAGLEEDTDMAALDEPIKVFGQDRNTTLRTEVSYNAYNFGQLINGQKKLAELLAAQGGITADQVAQALAPLILPELTAHVDQLDDDNLVEAAQVIADEIDRRERARLSTEV